MFVLWIVGLIGTILLVDRFWQMTGDIRRITVLLQTLADRGVLQEKMLAAMNSQLAQLVIAAKP